MDKNSTIIKQKKQLAFLEGTDFNSVLFKKHENFYYVSLRSYEFVSGG